MKGRVSVIDLMDRPFREVHELYRILYLRAEAQQKAEEERIKKEEEEAKKQQKQKGGPQRPTPTPSTMSTDVNQQELSPSMPPIAMDELEDALDELM